MVRAWYRWLGRCSAEGEGGDRASVAAAATLCTAPAGSWTSTVQRLLEHVRSHGVNFLPRPLGVDEHGREVLTYLPGTVPTYPL